MKNLTVSDLIVDNMSYEKLNKSGKPETIIVPPLPDKIKQFKNVNDICAITGEHIKDGVRVIDIVTDATSQPHETLKYRSDYVSVNSATLFKWVIGGAIGNLYADNTGLGTKPMVSRDSSKKYGRPCWIDLIRDLDIGTKTACIFTQESKRRLWPFANIGCVGENWSVYLYTDDYQGNIMINYEKLLKLLTFLEDLYDFGFNKNHMKGGLIDLKYLKKTNLELSKILDLEQRLNQLRETNEFLLAIFIIQPR